MNGIGAVSFLQTRLKTIAALGNRVYLGVTSFDPSPTLPLAAVVGLETDIERQDCETHHVHDTIIVEGHFAVVGDDVLTPGHALLAAFQAAIKPAACDYTYDGQFIDLTFTGRRVLAREEGSSIGVCQLRLAIRYHEHF